MIPFHPRNIVNRLIVVLNGVLRGVGVRADVQAAEVVDGEIGESIEILKLPQRTAGHSVVLRRAGEADADFVGERRREGVKFAERNQMVGLQKRRIESAELSKVVERDQLIVDVATANLILVAQVVIQ